MRKPLLTDELLEELEQKKRMDHSSKGFGYYEPGETPKEEQSWEEDEYMGYREGYTYRIPVETSIVKSRRIETLKREKFRSKVNKILFWVICLVILFLLAVFFW